MNGLVPIEHKSQRVLTTQQIAEGYNTDAQVIRNNFNRNKERYVVGVHYYVLEGAEFQGFRATNQFELPPNINSMYIWTEKGALLHAKSLNTDSAWDVYNELVDTYFRKQQTIDYSKLSPELQMVQALLLSSARLELEVKQLQTTTQAIKDTIITQPDNWREDLNRMFNKIALAIGENEFKSLRSESYKLLESRAGVNLERRLDNLRARLLKDGASKTRIDKACKLDCIEEDKKLREIYAAIAKEYSIRYVA